MHRPLATALLVSLVGACGGLASEPPSSGAAGASDAADGEAPSADAGSGAASDAGSVTDAARPRQEAGTCPAQRPTLAEGCAATDEGRSCVFGIDCRAECVCERGSWVCASDTCAATCPGAVPTDQACAAADVDRVCVYRGFCAPTCRCDGAVWRCLRPPC